MGGEGDSSEPKLGGDEQEGELIIRCSNGSKFSVRASLDIDVASFKSILSQNCDIPADQQRLIYKGRILKDDQTLISYGLQADHTVHLVRAFYSSEPKLGGDEQEGELIIRCSNGSKFSVRASLDIDVASFKSILSQNCDIPADQQRLIYKGRILKDDQTLISYGLQADHTVHLVRAFDSSELKLGGDEQEGELIIRCSNGSKFSVRASLDIDVASFKSILSQNYDIPADQQRLIYKGRILKDDQTLISYGLQADHTVHLVRAFDSSEPKLGGDEQEGELIIRCSNGSKFSVRASLDIDVASFKSILSQNYDIPADQQRLIYKGRILKDDQTLISYGLQADHTVHLVRAFDSSEPKLGGDEQEGELIIRCSNGSKFSVRASLEIDVASFKSILSQNCDIPADQQRLIYKGRILKDDQTLISYGLQADHTVHLVRAFDSSEPKLGGDEQEGEVIIRCSNGSKFSVIASLDIDVASFKSILYQNCDIPADQQRLIYKGRILKDDQTLISYGLQADHTVHLIRAFDSSEPKLGGDEQEGELIIRCSNGSKFSVRASLDIDVASFKSILSQNCDIPADQQRLIYKGRILKDDQTLISYGLQADHTVHLVRAFYSSEPKLGGDEQEGELIIRCSNGSKFSVRASLDIDVASFKSILSQNCDIPADQQRLIYKGRILKDDQTLISYGLQADHTVHLVRAFYSSEPKLGGDEQEGELIIRCSNGSKFSVIASLNIDVASFKSILSQNCDIPADQQRLIYKGRILKDDQTLISYGLQADHTVHLVRAFDSSEPKLGGDEQEGELIIRCSNGSKFSVRASLDIDVASFKSILSQNCDIPADQQRLIYKGRILKDDQTLISYGLQADHTVHLVRAFDSSEPKLGGDEQEGELIIRCSNGSKFSVRASLDIDVASFKSILSQNCDIPADQQRLIYKGRILKDDQTLISYGLQADHTVHLVRAFDSSEPKLGGDEQEGELIIRCSNGSKFSVRASLDIDVPSFKSILSQNCDIPADQQRLIYKGRILKDDQTLISYGLQADHTVHLVRAFTSGSSPAPAVNANPAGPTAAGVLRGVEAGVGSGLFGSGLPGYDQVQQQLTQNPNMMRDILNTPMIRNLMNNPELMRGVIMNNPQIRDIIDPNPELAHVLNDPSILRQTLEAARNPEIIREMMRNTDRAMSNIEASPEGFNMLRRMYENVQEPLLNATTVSGNAGNDAASNPFAALLGNQGGAQARNATNNPSTTGSETTAGSTIPDANPLPNPWSNNTGVNQTNVPRSNTPLDMRAEFPNLRGLGGLGGLGGAGGLGGLGGSGGLSGMEQMLGGMPDPNAMSQLLQNPAISQMMQSMLSNPQYMDQILSLNPQLRAMVDANPQLREMMQSPELLRQLTNPETMQQMLGLQQQLYSPMNQQPSILNPTQAGGATGTPNNGAGLEMLMNMFGGLGAGSLSAPASNVPPEERFATQLSQLQEMGFFDTQENISALLATSGNVHAAVERLLGNLPGA